MKDKKLLVILLIAGIILIALDLISNKSAYDKCMEHTNGDYNTCAKVK